MQERRLATSFFNQNTVTGLTTQVEFSATPGDAVQPAYTTTYYHGDHLGSSRLITNGTGTGWPIWSSTYLPFGQEWGAQNSANHHKFTGKERDTESGLDYFEARYLSSNMGRFMSPDPITVTPARMADPQQLNLYSYVTNNPLVLTDPTGMIINTDDLNDKDKALWQKVVDLANKQDANGNYVNGALHDAYSKLDGDSRVFRIEDNPGLGAGTAGQFEITKFNGTNDFSEAKVSLNFNVIKGINSTTQGDFDSSFQKYAGLLGKSRHIPFGCQIRGVLPGQCSHQSHHENEIRSFFRVAYEARQFGFLQLRIAIAH